MAAAAPSAPSSSSGQILGSPHMVAAARASLFCDACGSLLALPDTRDEAKCPACPFERKYETLAKQTPFVMRSTPADLLRRHGVEPLVPLDGEAGKETEARRERATVDELCPKCNHRGLDYYTMQLRSADEGQTVFYECKKCAHKFSVNT